MDRSVAHASPINAIVVLSRADEIGAARPDALDSARPSPRATPGTRRVRELASGVVPVAGLIAETGATLRETQFGWLRAIAGLPEASRDRLLLSVERFRDPDAEPARRGDPRGTAGAARAVRAPPVGRPARRRRRRGPPPTCRPPCSSGRASASCSGSSPSATGRARRRSRRAPRWPPCAPSARTSTGAASTARPDIVVAVDRLEASSQELALLRLLHLVLTGAIELTPDERARGRPPVRGRAGRPSESASSPTPRRTTSGRGAPRHRTLALPRGQPVQRPAHDRGGRDRQPRLRGDLRGWPV